MKKKKVKNPRLGVVGGQAVLDGVMMKHKENYSIAVRRENGDIIVTDHKFLSARKKHKFLNIPIIRGVVNFVEMLILSIRTLNQSAESLGIVEEQETKFEKWLKNKFGKSILDIVMLIGIILGLALSVFLFIFLPTAATSAIKNFVDLGNWQSPVEGVFKIVIFIAYLLLVSLIKDIRRNFQYHGAEHKTVFCYESEEELTVENVKKHSRFHPRCGTSFIFVIIAISILVSSLPFVPKEPNWLRFLVKILMLPVIIGLGFEFIMIAGKSDNLIIRVLSAPGLWMQRITTKTPDDGQIEVAIYALKSAMPEQFPEFALQLEEEKKKREKAAELFKKTEDAMQNSEDIHTLNMEESPYTGSDLNAEKGVSAEDTNAGSE